MSDATGPRTMCPRCWGLGQVPMHYIHDPQRADLHTEALLSLDRLGTAEELPGDRLVVRNAIRALA